MIPFIRSLSELMAITESRDSQKSSSKNNKLYMSTVNIEKKNDYSKSFNKKKIDLPNFSKTISLKWIQNKKSISRFIDDLDYNNQIQSSYDLTLLERQNKRNQQDAA